MAETVETSVLPDDKEHLLEVLGGGEEGRVGAGGAGVAGGGLC